MVEDFIPRDHIVNGKFKVTDQAIEYRWVDKALRMLYVPSDKTEDDRQLVYTTAKESASVEE
jgi:hypothetical protein